MSIVLIIMSVVVGAGFAVASNYASQQKEKKTQANLDLIETALLDFRKANDRLPCPADGTLNPDNSNYGIEAANRGTCSGGTPAANFINAAHATKKNNLPTRVVGGVVPVETLGLPKSAALDGWGNKISYHVDAQATETGAFSTYTVSNDHCFNVIVDDAKTWANDADRNYLTFHGVYALVSHGKDADGAFSVGGAVLNTGSINVFEQRNAKKAAGYNNLFHQLPETVNPDDPKDIFDDIVRFKTRTQLRTSQDGPSIIFPDLIVTDSYVTGNQYGTQFYFRCRDRFVQESEEMVDMNGQRVTRVSISPNNEYILGSMTNDYHFRMWIYDGIRTTMLPDSSFPFTPFHNGTAETGIWSHDGRFFLVSALDYPTPYYNRISIFQKTGANLFPRVDSAVASVINSNGQNVLQAGSFDGVNMNPVNDDLIIMYGGTGAGAIKPVYYKHNPDNTFSYIANAIPEMPAVYVRRPEWSPDGNYLLIFEMNTNAMYLFRSDGNHHYSKIATPSPAMTSQIGRAAFSPDSRFLVTTSQTNGEWRIYELRGNDQYIQLSSPNHPANLPRKAESIQFSPDGKYLAVGLTRSSTDVNLRIYKIEGRTFRWLNGADEGVDQTPDGSVNHSEWRRLMPWEKKRNF